MSSQPPRDPAQIQEDEPARPLSMDAPAAGAALEHARITEDESPRPGVVGATVGAPLDGHRFSLASQLLWLVAATTMVLIVAVFFAPADHLDAVTTIAGIVFGPLVTLLGTSFAWYYATRK